VKSTKEIFVSNLRRLRKAKFPSQGAFAKEVSLSERGYQKYEQGETDPIPEVIDRFAEKLGCFPADLITEKQSTSELEPNFDFSTAAAFLARFSGLPHPFQKVILALIYKDGTMARGLSPKLEKPVLALISNL
jgi:transcriptional regulator with XRE-family HTH domain